MASKICIKADKSMFQSSGKRFSAPFIVHIDDGMLGNIGYNERKVFEVPPGKHSITLQGGTGGSKFVRKFGCEALNIETTEGENVNIAFYADVEAKKVYFSDCRDKASASRVKRLARCGKARQLAMGVVYLIGICTLIFGGALIFSDYFSEFGLNGFSAMVFGLIFIALGVWAGKGSNIALILAIIIYGLDGYAIFMTLRSLYTDQGPLYIFSYFHGAFLLIMIVGTTAGLVYKQTCKRIKKVGQQI